MTSLSASSPPTPTDDISEDEEEQLFTMDTFLKVGAAMSPIINDVHRSMCEVDPVLADFICGLEGTLPVDPIRASDGYIYGRAALTKWCIRSENQIPSPQSISPCSKKMVMGPRGVPICLDDYQDDVEIKEAIDKIVGGYFHEVNIGKDDNDRLHEVDFKQQGGGASGEFEWQPHGKQAPGCMRHSFVKMTHKEQLESIGTTDLCIALSKSYRELDEQRELMSKVLTNWQCPCMVVIGEEGHGKSSLMEQLFMLPIFARGKKRKFCTRMAIHCRLRRTPDESSITLSIRDINQPEVQLEGHTSVIPLTNGYEFVEKKMMECVDLFNRSGSGIVTDKILVLEVKHPQVATIDLIDLPGSCTIPEDKAKDIQGILEHQVAQDKKRGGLVLYLAVVTCTTKPTTSNAIQFLKNHDLLEKSFGIFTMCDKLHHDDYVTLEGWITGLDPEQEDGIADGYVALGGGWTATTLMPPRHLDPEYYTAHSIERLNIQKYEERLFFQSDELLQSLTTRKLCGVASLVVKIEPVHDKLLHGEFKTYTMRKISETLQIYEFDLKLLGNVGLTSEADKNIRARAEVKRRLGLALPGIGLNFQQEFLKLQMGDLLSALLKSRDTKVWKYGEIKLELDLLKTKMTHVVFNAVEKLPSQWIGEIKEILTAPIVPRKQSGTGWNLGFGTLSSGIIGNLLCFEVPTRKHLLIALKDTPMFQLCAYQGYTTRIIKQCESLLRVSVDSIKIQVLDLIEHFFSLKSPEWFTLLYDDTYSSVTVGIKPHLFSSAVLSSFAVHSPLETLFTESYLDVEVGDINPQQLEECAKLETKVTSLFKARDGVVRALNMSPQEVSQFESEVTWEEEEDVDVYNLIYNQATDSRPSHIYSGNLQPNSQDPRVNLFFALVRNLPDARLHEMVNSCFALATVDGEEMAVDMFLLTFQTRDCRDGKGERSLFQKLFLELAFRYPETAIEVLPLIPKYGYYKDLFFLAGWIHAEKKEHFYPLRDAIIVFAADKLANAAFSVQHKDISCLVKWAPREGSCHSEMAKLLAAKMFPNSSTSRAQYRKTLRNLKDLKDGTVPLQKKRKKRNKKGTEITLREALDDATYDDIRVALSNSKEGALCSYSFKLMRPELMHRR